jgi:hypothetical protein
MSDVVQEILREAETLPKEYQASVVTFVRFLSFQELAKQYGIHPDELLRLCEAEISKRADKDFQKALEYVLENNKELYRRLSSM